MVPVISRLAQTWVCDVGDILTPLEAEGESLHAPAAAFFMASIIFIT
jgi:hypothetical protein